MQCFVYKGNRKVDTYLYTSREGDFSDIPEALLQLLGDLEQVICLDLSQIGKLANADIDAVTVQLKSHGYYVQMPPTHDIENYFSTT